MVPTCREFSRYCAWNRLGIGLDAIPEQGQSSGLFEDFGVGVIAIEGEFVDETLLQCRVEFPYVRGLGKAGEGANQLRGMGVGSGAEFIGDRI